MSSTNYALDESVGEMLGAPSGRLMVYDPVTKKSQVLLESIHFANGIVLSADEDYLVFAECLRYRLHKYFISGPKAGTFPPFVFFIFNLKNFLKSVFLRVYGNIFG